MKSIKKTHQYIVHYKTIVSCLLLLFFCISNYAQNTNNQQVKRLQRAIFVFNFAQQINWQNQENNDRFNIGVLGPDRTLIDFKSLAQKRQIKNKPVNVINFNSVKDIKDVQLLYVNKSYNFDINYILNKIDGQNILLVTEDYNYNTSMINMVNVGDSFEYEINTTIIEKEGFVINNSLKQYAVSSSQKWKDLYQVTEASLNESKKNEAKQKEEIKNKEAEIISKQETIDTQGNTIDTILNSVSEKNKWIETLANQNELQQQKFEDKVNIERELEYKIKQQVALIQDQENKIEASNLEINKQLENIKKQNTEIEKNEVILKAKDSKINSQKTVNTLLVALFSLALIAGLLMYRSNRARQKLNTDLELKNAAIQKQALALTSKNDELEQFAYIASHDLKEPLITISSLISLLVEEYEDKFDNDGKTTLGYIQDSSSRMQKLIDAILQYSRLGKSKNIVDVNCNSIINILEEDLKNVIDRTETTIISNDLPTVKGAELELRLLFQNLISNGIKFTKKDTKPVISIDAVKRIDNNSTEFWEFSIQDNGIGIPEKHKERIFSIFQRLHSRDEYEGTGIGLAHCKKIIEAHGGKIWLDSVVGQGTTFYFTIPA